MPREPVARRRRGIAAACLLLLPWAASAAGEDLPDRARQLDANGSGAIEQDEARGRLEQNFAEIDCDKNRALSGAEIRAFFAGTGCPAASAAAAPGPAAAPARGPAQRRARVVVDTVVSEPVSQTFPVIGRLVARQSGVIATRVAGALTEVAVSVGDRVEQGAVIGTLARERLAGERDRSAAAVERYGGMVTSARAEYEKKERELRRMEELRGSAAYSRAVYEDVERDVQSRLGSVAEKQAQLHEAQAQLRLAELDLRDAEIRAPFSGVVTEKHTDVGTYLRIGDRIVTLLNDRDIEIETNVPSDRIGGLTVGRELEMQLDDGTRHTAIVRALVPEENLRTRTRPVRLAPRFNGTDKSLAVNQSLTVHVPLRTITEAITVHKDAIMRTGSESFVYVVEGEKPDARARRLPVELDAEAGSRFIVAAGLRPGDRVVVRGNETLGRGGPVEIVAPRDERAASR